MENYVNFIVTYYLNGHLQQQKSSQLLKIVSCMKTGHFKCHFKHD